MKFLKNKFQRYSACLMKKHVNDVEYVLINKLYKIKEKLNK